MDAEFISHERLFISQIVISVARKSLEQQQTSLGNTVFTGDCYLQFSALILLDYLFQNLLPVPTFQNEEVKTRRNSKPNQSNGDMEMDLTIDIEALSISEGTPEVRHFAHFCSST